MKRGPDEQKLDVSLRAPTLVAGGFMGDDLRSVTEVIDADAGELFRLGMTLKELASRMQEITDKAAPAQGLWWRSLPAGRPRWTKREGLPPVRGGIKAATISGSPPSGARIPARSCDGPTWACT